MVASYLAGCHAIKSVPHNQDQPIRSNKFDFSGSFDAALKDGWVFKFAAAGSIFFIDDLDQQVSNWATKHNPVFGSDKRAQDYATDARNVLITESLLLTGLNNVLGISTNSDYNSNHIKNFFVDLGAAGATSLLTESLKKVVDRERPVTAFWKKNGKSFPSGHTSTSFSSAMIANRYIDDDNFKASNYILATSVGWGRIEAGKHHPSDVLWGAALGLFTTKFIHEFFGYSGDYTKSFLITPTDDGITAQLSFAY